MTIAARMCVLLKKMGAPQGNSALSETQLEFLLIILNGPEDPHSKVVTPFLRY